MDELGPAVTDASMLVLPLGTSLDPQVLLDVATRSNAAHAALGTELLGVVEHGATIRLAWRPDLAGAEPRRWANGVVVALLDHVCSLTGVVSLGDSARFGGTMGLRVEYGPPAIDVPVLVAHATGRPAEGGVLRVVGSVHAPGLAHAPFATAHCTVAVAR